MLCEIDKHPLHNRWSLIFLNHKFDWQSRSVLGIFSTSNSAEVGDSFFACEFPRSVKRVSGYKFSMVVFRMQYRLKCSATSPSDLYNDRAKKNVHTVDFIRLVPVISPSVRPSCARERYPFTGQQPSPSGDLIPRHAISPPGDSSAVAIVGIVNL